MENQISSMVTRKDAMGSFCYVLPEEYTPPGKVVCN